MIPLNQLEKEAELEMVLKDFDNIEEMDNGHGQSYGNIE